MVSRFTVIDDQTGLWVDTLVALLDNLSPTLIMNLSLFLKMVFRKHYGINF